MITLCPVADVSHAVVSNADAEDADETGNALTVAPSDSVAAYALMHAFAEWTYDDWMACIDLAVEGDRAMQRLAFLFAVVVRHHRIHDLMRFFGGHADAYAHAAEGRPLRPRLLLPAQRADASPA